MPTLPLPQLPVASACWNRSVIIPGRTAADTVIIGPLTPMRSSWYFMSRVRFLKATRNRSARSGPASRRRLFLKWSLSSCCRLPSFSWMTRIAISPRNMALSLRFFVASAQVWQEVFVQGSFGFLQSVLFNLSVGNTVADE